MEFGTKPRHNPDKGFLLFPFLKTWSLKKILLILSEIALDFINQSIRDISKTVTFTFALLNQAF
ncbi:MAG: hypothetical protein CL925_15070 [Deltaproteobacteria bacterium]|nr:hypothetical protein [Deltaproteobacteria bacterium]